MCWLVGNWFVFVCFYLRNDIVSLFSVKLEINNESWKFLLEHQQHLLPVMFLRRTRFN